MPDLPATPLDRLIANEQPDLTISQFAALSNHSERTIKLWLQRSIIPKAETETQWPHRTLIPYDALITVANRARWGERKRGKRILRTDRGLPVPVTKRVQTDSRD